MRHTIKFCVILLALATTAGCTLPEHPYDYCGPVWQSGSNENCRPNYRAGSILNDQGPVAAAPATSAPIVSAEPLPLPAGQPADKSAIEKAAETL